MGTKPTLGQILGIAGGVLLFIFGFLDWYSHGPSGWDIPIGNWAPLLGIIAAAVIAVLAFVKAPQLEKVDVKPASLMLAAGLLLTLDTFSFLIADSGDSIAAGLILSFICALILLAGGILDTLGIDPIAGAGASQAQAYGQPPAGYPQPQSAYPQPPSAYPPSAPPQAATPPPAAYPPPAPQSPTPPPAPGAPPAGTETQVVQPTPPPAPGQGF